MSQPTSSVLSNVTKWLAIISTVLTIGLTALNAYWSRQVSETETEIKLQAADLERQRLELDAGKEKLSRYTFVQNLLSGVLTQDATQKNLTINLINLALTEQEAQQLFAGLQASNDENTRNVGAIGSDVVALTNLILQMNDAAKENRIGAVEQLIAKYRENPSAVDLAVQQLEFPQVNSLSASGRINVLVFLCNTTKNAWTQRSILRAREAITAIRLRESEGVSIGKQTEETLGRLTEHLANMEHDLSS